MQKIPLAGTWRGGSRARRGERERLALRRCRDGERDSWLTVFYLTTLRSCNKCHTIKKWPVLATTHGHFLRKLSIAKSEIYSVSTFQKLSLNLPDVAPCGAFVIASGFSNAIEPSRARRRIL